MATVKLIEYKDASPEAQAVLDDIKATRKVEDVNNFWKALANQPQNLKRVWESTKEIMAPNALDGLTKELVYLAVSIANNCDYCVHTHTAAASKKGMTEAQYEEFMAVIGLAMQNNGLASGMKIPIDSQFLK